MSLSNFFQVNLPYGMYINEEGAAMVFNREYRPIGINALSFQDHEKSDLPVYTHYKGLTEKLLLQIADGGRVERYQNGRIKMIWFYHGTTHPTLDDGHWNIYVKKVKLLSKLQREH